MQVRAQQRERRRGGSDIQAQLVRQPAVGVAERGQPVRCRPIGAEVEATHRIALGQRRRQPGGEHGIDRPRRDGDQTAVDLLQQAHQIARAPVGQTQCHVLHGAARRCAAGQRRGLVDHGRRQPSGVDQRARKRVGARQSEHRVAEQPLGRAGRRQEARGALGGADVVPRGRTALGVIAVEQRLGRPALQHQRKLPREVLGILDARVAAARAERAHHVRGIAGKQHPPGAETLQALAAVGVRPNPHQFVLDFSAELPAQPLVHHLRTAHAVEVGVGRHLVVQAPDAVGHQVLPDRAAFVEGCLDPGPALHRRRCRKAHVADAPAVGHARRLHAHAERLRKRAVAAAAVHHERGLQRVAADRGFDLHLDMVRMRHQPLDPVAPAQVHHTQLVDPVDQEPLDVELLQVDEGRLARRVMGG